MGSRALITGMGCICGAGKNLRETVERLYAGARHPKPPRRISYRLDKDYPVFEVPGFERQANDLSAAFAEIAIDEALAQAGLDADSLRGRKVGIFLGSTAGCFFNREDYYREFRRNNQGDPSYLAQVLLNGSIAHQIGKKYGFTGPATTLSNACASGTDAIGLAAAMVERGECDLAVAGGCDEIVRMVYLGFVSLMNTSDEPCIPFARDRKGLNLGEGAGICILESGESVRGRDVRPLATIEGYATFSDAYHVTAPEPTGRGLKKAFEHALSQAGIGPGDVAFVNTHGTGTSENDRVEGRVIAEIFGDGIPITATKAYTGHALGAAGGIEAVLTVQFLNDQKIPGVPEDYDFDQECRIRPSRENRRVDGRFACSSSLAFGGVNSVIVMGRTT